MARFSPFGLFIYQYILFWLGASFKLKNVRQRFHLKSLTVRPAVRWALAALEDSFRHHHWAGLTEYTKLFSLALSYVFGKQSDDPCY